MKLKLVNAQRRAHRDMGSSICLAAHNAYFTASDDKTIVKWDLDGQCAGTVCELDTVATSMDWCPSQGTSVSDVFAATCTDGTLRIVNKSGREEIRIEAHKGAAICVRWSPDGGSLVTCGEDGAVKSWSRAGMARSTISQTQSPVYSLAWGPDGDQMVFCSGKDLIIRALQNAKKQLKWKAHDGVISKVDWSPVNHWILSGGEDCRYRIWDDYGRPLFSSSILDNVVTSLSWKTSGDLFVVGCFGFLRLCDKSGLCLTREAFSEGSPFDIAWSTDGTQIGVMGGSGALVLGHVIGKRCQWKSTTAELTEPRTVSVLDHAGGNTEQLDFRDRVVELAMKYNHLVIATHTQCYIYTIPNWNTPHIFDIKNCVFLLVPSQRHFVMIDNMAGIQVYSYDGKLISNPKLAGTPPEYINDKTISISSDIISVIDRSDGKTIRCFDVASGKPIGKPIVHPYIIEMISMSQRATDRLIAFIDSNRDLYISDFSGATPYKFLTMVESIAWAEDSDMIVALSDGKIFSWYYPKAMFVDKDLLDATMESLENAAMGHHCEIESFYGTQLSIKCQNGTVLYKSIAPYPAVLAELVQQNKWDQALRLCRHVKSRALWATLAAVALGARDLERAEQALANLGEVAKQHYLLYIMEVPSDIGKKGTLSLYQRRPDSAESIFLQANPPLFYRAIKMNIRLFRWSRALKIAQDRAPDLLEVVLFYRQNYLQALGVEESDADFLALSKKMTVDPSSVEKKKQSAYELEKKSSAVSGPAAAAAGGGGVVKGK